MSTHLKEKEEKTLEAIEHLSEESSKGILIVVEGKKDVEALRALGIGGPIISLKTGGKTMVEAQSEIEKSNPREVILLLDFDNRGKQATLKLKQNLERARIKPNTKFWHYFHSLLGKEVQCIESLTSYLATLRQKLE